MNSIVKNKKSVMIHQPHFCAWLPYYSRIASVEKLVILDNVNYRKYSFHDRTYLYTKKGQKFLVKLPTNGSPNLLLKDVKTFQFDFFKFKFLKSIFLNYKKHEFFDEVWSQIESGIQVIPPSISLVELNISLIELFLSTLKIEMPKYYRANEITSSNDRNNRIIDICKKIETYDVFSGWGVSEKIHDMQLLHKENIRFVSISQDEFSNCFPEIKLSDNASIIDTLMKIGIEKTNGIISNYSKLYNEKQKTGIIREQNIVSTW